MNPLVFLTRKYNRIEQAFLEVIDYNDPPEWAQARARIKLLDEFSERDLDWFFNLYEPLSNSEINPVGALILAKTILEKEPSPC